MHTYLRGYRYWISDQWPLSGAGGQIHRSIFLVPPCLPILQLLGLSLNFLLDFWFFAQAEVQGKVLRVVGGFSLDCRVVWQWGDVFGWRYVGGGGHVTRRGDMSVWRNMSTT